MLKKRYNKCEYYTEGQVIKTIEEYKLNESFIEYALAMYMEPSECDGVLAELGKSKKAAQLRKHIAVNYIGGGSDFTFNDICSTSEFSSGCDGSTTGGDGDGGGDGD